MADRSKIPAPDQRLNFTAYSADELHQILVGDALAHYATELTWFVAAVQRIAQIRRRSVEQAMQDIVAEVAAAGGTMPLHSGVVL